MENQNEIVAEIGDKDECLQTKEFLDFFSQIKIDRAREDLEDCDIQVDNVIETIELPCVKENDIFLSALAVVGIITEKSGSAKFSPCSGLLPTVGSYESPFYHKNKLIVGFTVPYSNCNLYTYRLMRTSYILSPEMHGSLADRAIIGVREKRDGYRAVVFGVNFDDGSFMYVYWDHEMIVPIDVTESIVFERINNILFIVSGICSEESRVNIKAKLGFIVCDNDFEELTMDLVESCEEGLVLLVDGEEFKVPKLRVVSLKARLNGTFPVFCDKQGVAYDVKGALRVDEGIFDFIYTSGRFFFHRPRPDKMVPDSTQTIKQVISDLVVLDDLKSHFCLKKGRNSIMSYRTLFVDAKDRAKTYSKYKGVYVLDMYADSSFLTLFRRSRLKEFEYNSFSSYRNRSWCFDKRYPLYSVNRCMATIRDRRAYNVWAPGRSCYLVTSGFTHPKFLKSVPGYGLVTICYGDDVHAGSVTGLVSVAIDIGGLNRT